MICATCQNWFSRCDSNRDEARKWAEEHGFTGPLAPQQAPIGPRCPGYFAIKRSNSRTTTPCYTETL